MKRSKGWLSHGVGGRTLRYTNEGVLSRDLVFGLSSEACFLGEERKVLGEAREVLGEARKVLGEACVKSPVGHGGKSVKSSLESSVRQESGSINAMVVSLVAKAYCRV